MMNRALVLLVLVVVLSASAAVLALDADIKCESDKNKIAGKYAVCRLKAISKA